MTVRVTQVLTYAVFLSGESNLLCADLNMHIACCICHLRTIIFPSFDHVVGCRCQWGYEPIHTVLLFRVQCWKCAVVQAREKPMGLWDTLFALFELNIRSLL
ncbi:hypothetical protein DEU56DRAFT_834506 [Suillus clintonianus]|uniref:uncharacterized protein n=1 Tax=Suillus clintonianus TaxID=1904413 RepID=UPI001B884B13|nr:uncharacterized protein DEU56DRAFT_834506 [Suillus clintonianus]KAG2121323.1 hypothetical protein DEU56DRAFT_834506 [Suillus clintonianus]